MSGDRPPGEETARLKLALWHIANDTLVTQGATASWYATPPETVSFLRGLAVGALDGWEPNQRPDTVRRTQRPETMLWQPPLEQQP